jgi:hypothetical protein
MKSFPGRTASKEEEHEVADQSGFSYALFPKIRRKKASTGVCTIFVSKDIKRQWINLHYLLCKFLH